MSAVPEQVMEIIGDSHRVPERLFEGTDGEKLGGLTADGQYAWFAFGADFVLYSIRSRCAMCTKSFDDDGTRDKSFKVRFYYYFVPRFVLGTPDKFSATLSVLRIPRDWPLTSFLMFGVTLFINF